MKNLLIFLSVLIVFSCNKQVEKTIQSPVDESVVLKPKEGYSSSKRADDFEASQLRGKPVKNQVGNITSLMTTVRSPYKIDLNWYGVNGAVKYNVYRNDVFVGSTVQPLFSDVGLLPNTKYKYQVAGVASNGTVGNLSNVVYGTTHSTDIGSKIIYFLQFDKDTTTSTNWIPYSNGQPLITEASGFTEEERQLITDSVGKDWVQFTNVKVTRDRAEYLAASTTRRTKTIYTQSHEWYSGSPTPKAGGVSYHSTLGSEIPNFVFTSALYYNPRYCWIAGTHESGHAVGGLRHAVDVCGQTYGGDGNHMGAAYHREYRFWKDGQLISGCTFQDQISILNNRTQ